MKRLAVLVLVAFGAAHAAPPIVIKNATVLTVTKGTFKGSVLVRDGKIVEAAPNVLVPAGATVIDAAGQYVMPGIIDPHSHIAADAINEGSTSVSSMVAIEDVLNARDIGIYRALAGGVTSVAVLHGSANTIGGQCSVIKTRWGKDARGILLDGARPLLKLALGENVKRSGQAQTRMPGASPANLRYPGSRMGVEDVLRESFADAKAYREKWRGYEKKKAAGDDVIPPRRDLRLEPLVAVLEGKMLVHAHCYRADEILMMLRVAQEFGFKIHALVHVLEGYKVADEIAAAKAGATTFTDWWAYKMEAADAIPYNAAILHRKGVLTSLNSDSDELMRHLNQEAAKVVKYGGLTDDEALAMITINPARQLALDDRIGSIEPGKDADLVIYDKHPLSNYAKVQKVMIDGEMYFDRDNDQSARPQKEELKKKLIEKEKAEEKRSGPPAGARQRRPS
jgi:imidazolonepropionase-like amidohydrolase